MKITFTYYLIFNFFFYSSRVDAQCCIHFGCTDGDSASLCVCCVCMYMYGSTHVEMMSCGTICHRTTLLPHVLHVSMSDSALCWSAHLFWVLDSTCEWQLGLGRSCSLGVEELSAWNAELDQDREHWKMTLGKHVTLIHLLPVKKRKCTLQGKKKKLWLAVTWLNRLCYEAEIFIDY